MAPVKLGHSAYDLWLLVWGTSICDSLPANIVLYIVPQCFRNEALRKRSAYVIMQFVEPAGKAIRAARINSGKQGTAQIYVSATYLAEFDV